MELLISILVCLGLIWIVTEGNSSKYIKNNDPVKKPKKTKYRIPASKVTFVRKRKIRS